jgi:hypothetical protein
MLPLQIFLFMETHSQIFGYIRKKNNILHSDKYSNIRHAEQGKRE